MGAALSGCVTISQDDATVQMRGLERTDVIVCAGAPYREAVEGNVRVMSYQTVRAYDGVLRQCDVSFALTDGRVTQVTYTGRDRTCQAVLKNCVAK